ncbi:4Fe-4S dicluster domain-containing protein [Sulfurovum sp. bin170]|uniref:4Fe-4S dicluster domain-containing protein n=1 Tax=Sulfurovum sp. bin170 TaxID=2695268 RepID=UPI0013E048DD|nr:4Fe-4S dicluster domain-containing protein [Sulfurovum sp. bin170]NEW61447.1 4Fe-4S dicluster domain-containing protein [Sulfurovum sp. bin170]
MGKIKTERREFIKYSTLGVLGMALAGGVGLSPYLVADERRLRPPGAVDEHEFLGLCIKCGQCLQVCPYHSIELADWGKGHGVGTPYIDANVRGCWACEAVPCVLACPTGALDHACEKAEDIEMGIAVLQFPRSCLAVTRKPIPAGYSDKMLSFIKDENNVTEYEREVLEKFNNREGDPCTLCADMCPMPNPLSAIEMVQTFIGIIKPVIYDGCTGCGVCQEVCPTAIPSIVIKPRVSYKEQYGRGRH